MTISSLKWRISRARSSFWYSDRMRPVRKWAQPHQKAFRDWKWKMTMKAWWPIRNFFSNNFVRLNITLARLGLLKLEGRSLSICISDILAGRIDERWVGKIVAGTKASNDAIWVEILEQYREVYWRDNPDRAVKLANHFRNSGMLEQPRVVDGEADHSIANGHWSGLFGRPFRLLWKR